MNLWVNPNSSTFGAGSAPVPDLTQMVLASEAGSLNNISIKSGSGIPTNTILDEMRVGTTWADVTPAGPSGGSCALVFDNQTPSQFIQKAPVTTNLSFVVRNDGADATNVTVSLTDNYSWLTADTATNSFALISNGSSVTNIFSVTIASNAPGGTYADAFTLNMQGTGTDGITSNFSSQVSLQVLNTAFSSMSKLAFAAVTNGTDMATLTVSNESAEVLSFILTNSPSAAWLSYPVGTLELAANTSTNITVTTDGSLTAGPGNYSTVLAVTYLNNYSSPNPKNFSLSFDVSSAVSLLVNLSGDFNTGTGNINYVMPALTTTGETLIYDNDFGTAIVTNGALGTGGSYVGPDVYGSFRHTMIGGTAGSLPEAPVIMRVASSDYLSFYAKDSNTVGEVGLAADVDFMYVFKKADFANGLNSGSVSFDSSSPFSVDTPSYNASTKLLRAVVQNGSTWYISQASNTVASASANKAIVTNASAAQWAVWDPLTSIDTSTQDFSTTVAGSTFTDIQAVGIYAHMTKTALGTVIQTGLNNIKIGGIAGSESAYTLTVNNGNGDGSFTNGTQVAIAADAPGAGKAFVQWTGDTSYLADSNSASTTVTMPAQAVAVTATYVDLYYGLTVNSGSGSGSYTNATKVAISADVIPGQAFVRWTGSTQYVASATASSTTVTMPAQEIALTATYVNVYTLTVNSGSGSGSYTNTRVQAIAANVIGGKTFVAWTGDTVYLADSNSASTTVTMPAQAVAVTATYVDNTYVLTVTSGTGSGSFTNGHQAAISADVIGGKTFVAWTGDTVYLADSNSASTTVTMPLQAVSVTATYVDVSGTYALTVISGTGGGSYTNTEVVVIAADVIGGKTFVAWAGDTMYLADSNSASTTVMMPAQAVSVSATYVDNTYALTVTSGTGGGSYTNTEVVVITANAPESGYAFSQWTGDTVYLADSNAASTTVTMPAQAVAVTATYIATEQYTTNGTPYSWMDQYGLTNYVADDLLDQDNDGLLTWQEYIANTIPTSAASVLKAAQATRNVVTWAVQTNRIYSVYWSTNLVKGFTALDTNIVAPQGSYTNATPDSRANHYQIKVRMQ
jgi:hypothetical protein